MPGQSTKRACATAQARAINALKSEPEFTSINHERLLVLLSSKTPSLSRSDLIEASLSASNLDLDAELAKLVHQALPFDGDDEATKRLLYLALEAGMRACNADEAFKDEIKSTQLLYLVQSLARVGQRLDRIEDRRTANENRLIEQLQDKADALHVTRQLFIALAKRITADVLDFDQAYRELERMVDVAARSKDTLPTNIDEAVTAILTQVDALNDQGELYTAAKLIADEVARADAGQLRLCIKGINQAILTRDVNDACHYELRKLLIETPEQHEQFNALGLTWTSWYERGRDKGLNFDLEVAVEICHAIHARAQDGVQRGRTMNILGITLEALGVRARETDWLKKAVVAYRAALEERQRNLVPLDWAQTQNNLGSALQTLGSREENISQLEEAVVAYRAALEERQRDLVPLSWAVTQNNLGNALCALGTREVGVTRLEEAVVAYRAALEERQRDLVPLNWAVTQKNLAGALYSLGSRERGTARLKEAGLACLAALEIFNPNETPLDWADTQTNFGNILNTIGERENATEPLEKSVTVLRAALDVYTRENVPFNWAMTQSSLGSALRSLGAQEIGVARLEEAVTAFQSALEEYTRKNTPMAWATTQNNLGNALTTLGSREGSTDRLKEAVFAYRAALEVFTQGSTPLGWADTRFNLALTEKAFADHPATIDQNPHLQAALEHVEAALQVFDAEMTPFNHEKAIRLRDGIRVLLVGDG